MNARIKALGSSNDPIKLARVSDTTATITAATLRQLRSLPVPQGEQAALNAIYAKVDQLLADIPELSAALRARDRAAAQEALNKVTADSDAANKASNAYGLTVCGS